MVKNTELAWAAGLFDGEGCIYYAPALRGRVRLQLVMTDRRTVRRFGTVVGVPPLYYTYNKNNPKWRTGHAWQISRIDDTSTVLERLLPYLVLKRVSAQKALNILRHWPRKGKKRK